MIASLVRVVYDALGRGDETALFSVLAPYFCAEFAAGMPAGAGSAANRREARDHWWAIGRDYAVIPVVEEEIPCVDGRLLVRGTYRGRARGDGHEVDSAFTHLWTAGGGLLVHLEQVADTARW